MGRPRKRDIVRPGYQDRGKENDIPQKKVTKPKREGFRDRTPAEIQEECRLIREGWTEAERRSRAVDPKLREEVQTWTVPIINLGSLEVSVDGILPVESAPLNVVDELDPETPCGEREKCREDEPPWVRSIVLNKLRRVV